MYGEGVDPGQCRYETSLWAAAAGRAVERPWQDGAARLAAGESDLRLALRAVHDLPGMQLAPDAIARYVDVTGSAALETDLDGAGARRLTVYDDHTLAPGQRLAGPALVRGNYLTCLVADGWRLRVVSNGDLFIERS